jgi:anthranilate 1,2-dioxygenase large subunit
MRGNEITWPNADFSRVPYAVFTDPDIFELEQERIFGGPVWCYLALEAEIPGPGDFLVTYLGDTVVVVNRHTDGAVYAFVNRCAHRGSMLVREPRGNCATHTCVYHHWCYDLTGRLLGVPFQRGAKGKGGMPPNFDKAQHGLKRLRVAIYRGVIFGSLSPSVPPLEDYLDTSSIAYLDRLFNRPIEVLGYHRQRMPSNWKLYWENLNDPYHAGLLHQMAATFGMTRITQDGAIVMDRSKRHPRNYYFYNSDDAASAQAGYDQTSVLHGGMKLEDASVVTYQDEFGDGMNLDLLAIYPSCFFQQSGNRLLTRQIRPKSPSEFELYWTYFGYADDAPKLRQRRYQQANMSGPAGLIAMEDGESGVLIQRAIRREGKEQSVIEMGGTGPIEDHHHLCTEVALRGFWKNYSEYMGFRVAP